MLSYGEKGEGNTLPHTFIKTHHMQPYKSKSGDSGVTGYEIGKNFINIQFSDGSVYQYTYVTAGTGAVEAMKQLARDSKGLSTYITQHRPGFRQLD